MDDFPVGMQFLDQMVERSSLQFVEKLQQDRDSKFWELRKGSLKCRVINSARQLQTRKKPSATMIETSRSGGLEEYQ